MRADNGEIFRRVNAAGGARCWDVCEYSPEVRKLRPAEFRTHRIGPQPHGAAELRPSPVVGRLVAAGRGVTCYLAFSCEDE